MRKKICNTHSVPSILVHTVGHARSYIFVYVQTVCESSSGGLSLIKGKPGRERHDKWKAYEEVEIDILLPSVMRHSAQH